MINDARGPLNQESGILTILDLEELVPVEVWLFVSERKPVTLTTCPVCDTRRYMDRLYVTNGSVFKAIDRCNSCGYERTLKRIVPVVRDEWLGVWRGAGFSNHFAIKPSGVVSLKKKD